MVNMKVNRFVWKELWNDLKRPEITILLGARQVGKAYRVPRGQVAVNHR